MSDSYDVVIVGAGAAGCVLAARLSEERDVSVLLVEAGPSYGYAPGGQPDEIVDAASLVSQHDWGHRGRLGRPAQEHPLFAGKVLGGSSATNMVMALHGHPSDYDGWAAAGNPGWSFAEILPFFRRVERDLDFGQGWWHGTEGPVPVRRYAPAEMLPTQRAFLEACGELGYPQVADHNEPGAIGAGRQPVNEVGGVRWSAALTYLAGAGSRGNLTIRPDTEVGRVVVRGGRAVGIKLSGSGETIHAGEVVLSAGTFGSPTILLRSGIGPADQLRALGIPAHHDLPGVGRALHDHPLLRLRFATPNEAGPLRHQALLTTHSPAGQGAPELQVFPSGPTATPEGSVLTLLVALLQPHSRGYLQLVSTDPAVPPEIRHGHLSHADDLPRLIDGVGIARRIAQTPPLAERLTGELWPPAGSGPELSSAIEAGIGTYHHPVGTCRMGPATDRYAVVDNAARVHGVDGVRVVDASIMPTIPSANTHFPTLMLAERLSALMTSRDVAASGA